MDVFGSRNNNVTIMTFNPFKTTSASSSKSSPHHKQHMSDNDSWHSQPPQSVPSSGPLSWFSSGWTPSSTTTPQSMPTDNKQTIATSVSPASALVAPALPMIMLRASHSEGDMNTTNIATMASNERTDGHKDRDRTTIKSNVGNDLPSYPEQRIHQQQQQHMNNQSDRDANEKLLEDFPPKANRTLLEEFPSKHNQNKETDTINNSSAARKRIKPCIGDLEEAYPGFALYQTARVQYCLGKYNEALDTTTECLAFQKLALGSSKASKTSPKLRPRPSIKTANSAKTDDDSNNDMTALDLRSTFVTGVGRSMLGVVQSMKTSSTSDSGTSTSAQKQQQSHHHASPHPMLSNSMATIIAQYPLHPCIAQTLLLRGRVLADCGLYGLGFNGDTDFSLLLQAIRNVEMAVAILRKIDQEFDLATSLVLLGTLRSLLGHFDEADRAYKEALSLFRVLRLAAKYDQSQAIDKELIAICEISMRRINEGAADAFYRRGKLYQSRRMHKEAFQCYHKSLTLSKCNGAKRRDGCVRRVVRCMKNRSAIESIVSSYIDGSQCSIAYCDI
eukprot:scaffold1804_cov134-Skeletonema_marinoi.AAC.11